MPLSPMKIMKVFSHSPPSTKACVMFLTESSNARTMAKVMSRWQ